MDIKFTEVKKKFNINEGVKLPLNISKHKVNDDYLFLAPEKASLITTNEFGNKFVEYFSKNFSIKEVMEKMKSDGKNIDTIQSELNDFLIKIERSGFYEDAVVTKEDEKPRLQIDITNKCNLTCVHCLRDAGKPAGKELDTAEWLNVIDDFSSMFKTDITVSGGEPLLHPGFFDIIKKANDSGLIVTLFTNGVLIDEEVVKKIQGYVKKIQISLDGATEEVNDKIRGEGSFKKILQAVSFLYDTNIVLDMAFSIMPSNLKDFHENIEGLLKTLGPRINIKLSEVIKFGRADSTHIFSDSNEKQTEPEAKRLRDHLYKRRLKAPPGSSKNIKLVNCGYGEMVTISSVGDIYPCPMYESVVKYGNIRKDDFREILKKIDAARQMCSNTNMEECKTCDLRSICSGGCRINNIIYNSDILKPECILKPDYKDWMYSVVADFGKNNPISLFLGKNENR